MNNNKKKTIEKQTSCGNINPLQQSMMKNAINAMPNKEAQIMKKTDGGK